MRTIDPQRAGTRCGGRVSMVSEQSAPFRLSSSTPSPSRPSARSLSTIQPWPCSEPDECVGVKAEAWNRCRFAHGWGYTEQQPSFCCSKHETAFWRLCPGPVIGSGSSETGASFGRTQSGRPLDRSCSGIGSLANRRAYIFRLGNCYGGGGGPGHRWGFDRSSPQNALQTWSAEIPRRARCRSAWVVGRRPRSRRRRNGG